MVRSAFGTEGTPDRKTVLSALGVLIEASIPNERTDERLAGLLAQVRKEA